MHAITIFTLVSLAAHSAQAPVVSMLSAPRPAISSASSSESEHYISARQIDDPSTGYQHAVDEANHKANAGQQTDGTHDAHKHGTGDHAAGRRTGMRHTGDKHHDGKHVNAKHTSKKHSPEKHTPNEQTITYAHGHWHGQGHGHTHPHSAGSGSKHQKPKSNKHLTKHITSTVVVTPTTLITKTSMRTVTATHTKPQKTVHKTKTVPGSTVIKHKTITKTAKHHGITIRPINTSTSSTKKCPKPGHGPGNGVICE